MSVYLQCLVTMYQLIMIMTETRSTVGKLKSKIEKKTENTKREVKKSDASELTYKQPVCTYVLSIADNVGGYLYVVLKLGYRM